MAADVPHVDDDQHAGCRAERRDTIDAPVESDLARDAGNEANEIGGDFIANALKSWRFERRDRHQTWIIGTKRELGGSREDSRPAQRAAMTYTS